MNFVKFLRTQFLYNTSGGCFRAAFAVNQWTSFSKSEVMVVNGLMLLIVNKIIILTL